MVKHMTVSPALPATHRDDVLDQLVEIVTCSGRSIGTTSSLCVLDELSYYIHASLPCMRAIVVLYLVLLPTTSSCGCHHDDLQGTTVPAALRMNACVRNLDGPSSLARTVTLREPCLLQRTVRTFPASPFLPAKGYRRSATLDYSGPRPPPIK